MKRKAHYKAKGNGGARGRFQTAHQAGKRTGKRPVQPIPKKGAVEVVTFEQWAEEFVSNPRKILGFSAVLFLLAYLIKMLTT